MLAFTDKEYVRQHGPSETAKQMRVLLEARLIQAKGEKEEAERRLREEVDEAFINSTVTHIEYYPHLPQSVLERARTERARQREEREAAAEIERRRRRDAEREGEREREEVERKGGVVGVLVKNKDEWEQWRAHAQSQPVPISRCLEALPDLIIGFPKVEYNVRATIKRYLTEGALPKEFECVCVCDYNEKRKGSRGRWAVDDDEYDW